MSIELHGGHLTVGSLVALVDDVAVEITVVALQSGSKCFQTFQRNRKKLNFHERSKNQLLRE